MVYILIPVVVGCILDRLFGDPQWLPHPIRFIGMLVKRGEKILRKFCSTPQSQIVGGAALSLSVIFITFTITLLIVIVSYSIHLWLGLIVSSLICYQVLAVKCLRDEGTAIYIELKQNNLEGARQKLSMIVGRDTATLDESRIIKSTVETIAENTSDGAIAPLIFMLIGGAPLGLLYKAINTLDSMIGYKNEKYLYFGRFAARLDDIANFIPARISAILMIGAARLLGFDYRGAWKIFKRDRFNHPSPNSAQTESVCAGALGVQLAGPNYYFGKLVEKPTIGDATRPIEPTDISKSIKLMYSAFALCLLMGIMIWLAIWAVGGHSV